MDLLSFDAQELYFEHADSQEVQDLIRKASASYASGAAELPLLQAYLRAPDSLNVLVALNRFYYYQHRLAEALLIAQKTLGLVQRELNFPLDFEQLIPTHINDAPKILLTQIRFYLFTLKSIGFLNMRMENLSESCRIFKKLVELDERDRIGVKALLELVECRLQSQKS